ncbi:MAG: VOC family protein [Pseudooceanicola sp.]|nr:VOC family protein [Pseudooceanicola sp.]
MAAVQSALPVACGPAIPVTRGDLRWRLTVAEDGRLPMGGVFPSVIEWQVGPLPPTRMPDAGLDLLRLDLRHPDPVDLRHRLAGLIDDPRIDVDSGSEAGLAALISTPAGPKWLR